MIYDKNRISSIGDIAIDINESYFGLGAFDFMQESAEDELSLFETAIKSDIDEVMIGESASELEVLNENFVTNAANKIKTMMTQFLEWLKSITNSVIAKIEDYIKKENKKFCDEAEKKLTNVPDDFKYSGKIVKISKARDIEPEKFIDIDETLYNEAQNASESEFEKIDKKIDDAKAKFNKRNIRKEFMKECTEDVTDKGVEVIKEQLNYLKGIYSQVSNLKSSIKKMESDAKDMAKKAEREAKQHKKDENGAERTRFNLMAKAANAYKTCCQRTLKELISIINYNIKVARGAVSKATAKANTSKNEGFEYEDEFVAAMIESANYEYESEIEEMSKAKCCDDDCDDPEDDKDEE